VKYLGKGGYGNVSLYYDNISKKEVAIKKLLKLERKEMNYDFIEKYML
jgi:serine/threonine protein kinase